MEFGEGWSLTVKKILEIFHKDWYDLDFPDNFEREKGNLKNRTAFQK